MTEATDAARQEARTKAIALLLMAASVALVPTLQAVAKYLSADYPVAQIVWARYFGHFAILLTFVGLRLGRTALLPEQLGLQLARGGLLFASTVLLYWALAHMPMADASALVFISPLVATALSPLILGERVGRHRWLAVLSGFVGALIVIRPGLAAFQWASLLALGAGVGHGLYLLTTRKLSGSASPYVTLMYTAALGAAVSSLALPFAWVTPDAPAAALLVLTALISAGAHFLLISAFERAQASLLAPLSFGEIVMATALGLAIFGDFPEIVTILGIVIVIGSGLYISRRETRRRAA